MMKNILIGAFSFLRQSKELKKTQNLKRES